MFISSNTMRPWHKPGLSFQNYMLLSPTPALLGEEKKQGFDGEFALNNGREEVW